MDDRSKLHAMIDQLPEDKLRSAESWLNGVLHPDPRLLAMVSERRQAQEAFMQRVRDDLQEVASALEEVLSA